ncbi:hypothetical protein BDZ89DRAFT_1035817 [Hymenopellis radicata]|nr:hypothetical protein BDZ89DRAFT_1035817 [Hymenopellis radicata]
MSGAMLAPLTNGSFTLLPKEIEPEYLAVRQCHVWAPFVDINEIRTTHWRRSQARRGLWRGREVEMLLASGGPSSWRMVEKMTNGLCILSEHDLDLFFPVLGHIVQDGRIIGLLSEWNDGDYVEETHRALMYDAFQQLEGQSIFFDDPDGWISESCFMVADGKIRLQGDAIASLKVYLPHRHPSAFEEASRVHWDVLNRVLSHVEGRPNFTLLSGDDYRWVKNVRLLAYIPSPERPRLLEFSLTVRRGPRWVKFRRNRQHHRNENLVAASEEVPEISYESDDNIPLPGTRASLAIRRVRQRQVYDPIPRLPTQLRYRSVWGDESDLTADSVSSLASP